MDELNLGGYLQAAGIEIRGYQSRAIDDLRERIRAGERRLVLQAATGAGKTICAAEIIRSSQARGKASLFLAHRRELVYQCSDKLARFGVPHGILMAGEGELARDTQVASIQTLMSYWQRRDQEPPPADLVVIDECFPAGTLVDGRPIESLRVNDRVWSVDHATEQARRSRVTQTFRSRPSMLVTVHLRDGRAVVCTPGHPFHTLHGYVSAVALTPGTRLTEVRDARSAGRDAGVRMVRNRRGVFESTSELPVPVRSAQGAGVLFGELPGLVDAASAAHQERGVPCGVQQDLRGEADAGAQPDARRARAGQGVGDTAIDWTSAEAQGRQWAPIAGSPGHVGGSAGGAVGGRARGRGGYGAWQRLPDALQGGYRQPWTEDSDRGGWPKPRRAGAPSPGQEERRVLGVARVDRVEVHEPGGDGRFDGRCPDGHVYNIEVAADHNYFANGILVHNCHRATAPSYKRLADWYLERGGVVLGLTATPMRGDGSGLADAFDAMVCCPTMAELTEQGCLVPARFFAPSSPDLTDVRISRGDYVEADLEGVMDRVTLVGDIVTHWLEHAAERKTVVFATSVRHSIHLCEEFLRSGVKAGHIDGSTPKPERDATLAALSRGEVQVVTNCEVLCEGWDQPDVSCLVLARPTKSPVRYLQMVGRVLRAFPGKVDALVLDHAGNVHEHGFPAEFTDWELTPTRHPNPTQAEREQREAKPITCEQCMATYVGKPACPECGHVHVRKGREVAYVDGRLGEVTKPGSAAVSPERESGMPRSRFYAELLGYSRERGFKDGWAAYAYREKYGAWPSRNWRLHGGQPPGAEVNRWVRHLWLKRRKEREAAAAPKGALL